MDEPGDGGWEEEGHDQGVVGVRAGVGAGMVSLGAEDEARLRAAGASEKEIRQVWRDSSIHGR